MLMKSGCGNVQNDPLALFDLRKIVVGKDRNSKPTLSIHRAIEVAQEDRFLPVERQAIAIF